uniref:triose-phosphate isomerase family protein n=1 Tax=Pseudomonas guineae TaxID=425504 RepID=UPI0030EC3681
MRRPMVAGNWKMHGTRASVAELINGLSEQVLPSGVDVAVFPSCLHISQVVDGLTGLAIAVGAQDCATEAQQGALTGEVATSQLHDARCSLVLVGHSERRSLLGEGDEVVTRKFAAAQSSGLLPVLCVGETLAQR